MGPYINEGRLRWGGRKRGRYMAIQPRSCLPVLRRMSASRSMSMFFARQCERRTARGSALHVTFDTHHLVTSSRLCKEERRKHHAHLCIKNQRQYPSTALSAIPCAKCRQGVVERKSCVAWRRTDSEATPFMGNVASRRATKSVVLV